MKRDPEGCPDTCKGEPQGASRGWKHCQSPHKNRRVRTASWLRTEHRAETMCYSYAVPARYARESCSAETCWFRLRSLQRQV